MNKKKEKNLKKDPIEELWETDVKVTYEKKGMNGLSTLYRKAATELRSTLREIERLNMMKTRLANMLLEIEEVAIERENTKFSPFEVSDDRKENCKEEGS